MPRRIVALLLILCAAAGCRQGVPVIDPGAKPPSVDGTISGRVIDEGSNVGLSTRRVDVTNVKTGARLSVTTDANGAFTIKVPPGTYRLQVELRSGETLAKAVDEIRINPSDLDANIEVVVRGAR
jgi:hypothetical protein